MSKTRTLNFWTNWLLATSILGAVMGALVAFTPLGEAMIAMMIRWSPIDLAPLSGVDNAQIRFVNGISGAVMLAWSVALAGIAHYAFRRGERWAWMITALSVLAWFAVDSIISAATGVYANILGNVVMLILFEIPLTATFSTMVRPVGSQLETPASQGV